ncbi:MAG: response regulator, partial [Candidatus Rokubacteria bacterium]|nr:response regulator [Candidatus Rokubacteria bacterium]
MSETSIRARILAVEDSPTQAEQLRHVLEEGGYEVIVAANGSQALSEARRHPPIAVVSDIVMPEMDGYTLCRRLKADAELKDIPVILVTELSGPHDILRALECGADSVIRKPYDERYLLSRLSYVQVNRELRKSEKTRMGVEIDIGGQRHFVSAERRQILDLLISTYEEAVHLNEELSARQREVERSAQILQGLYGIAGALNRATTEQQVGEVALEQALGLPGVRAGWISLREGANGFRLLAACSLPPALAAPGAFEGDCTCRRRLSSGELGSATNILECERLQRAKGDTQGLRYHASVPLWVGDQTVGVMNLAGPGPGLFSDEDLKTLYGVGNLVAIALERAQLLEHLEAEVGRRTAALAAETTERERAEETRGRLIAILEATPDFVAIGHADGRVVYYNRAARRMLGIWEDEDISTIRVPDTHPEWAGRLVLGEGIPAAIRDGVWRGETALLGRDGREIPVSQVIIAHRAPDGSVEFLSIIARDISE